MRGFTSAKGEKTFRRIVDATTRVIADEGVRAVTHRRVAAESEASVGLVTYYFSSTELLIAATLADIAAQETRVYQDLVEKVHGLTGDLDGIVDLLLTELLERREARKVITTAGFALTLELAHKHEEDDREVFGAWETAERELWDAIAVALGREADDDLTTYLSSTFEGLYLFAVITNQPEGFLGASRAGLTMSLQALRDHTQVTAS